MIVLSLILVIAFFLLWFGSYLFNYQPEFYEPRDVEREQGKILSPYFPVRLDETHEQVEVARGNVPPVKFRADSIMQMVGRGRRVFADS